MAAAGFGSLAVPVACRLRPPRSRRSFAGASVAAGAALRLRAGALEQRIALELGLDIGGKIKAGELQQLDGLHQLRRHHQRLALAELQVFAKRHGVPAELVRFLLVYAVYSRSGAAVVNRLCRLVITGLP